MEDYLFLNVMSVENVPPNTSLNTVWQWHTLSNNCVPLLMSIEEGFGGMGRCTLLLLDLDYSFLSGCYTNKWGKQMNYLPPLLEEIELFFHPNGSITV